MPDKKLSIAEYLDVLGIIEPYISAPKIGSLMDWRPDLADAWTVREHIVHLWDADLHGTTRLRFAVAEPGASVTLWEEESWAARLHYGDQDPEVLWPSVRVLRASTVRLLSGISEKTWQEAHFTHAQRGKVRIEDFLMIYTDHVRSHAEYIKRNEKLWLEAGKPN